MNSKVKQLTINYEQTDKKEEVLKRILPILLLFSFVWLNLYKGFGEISSFSDPKSGLETWSYVILTLIFSGGISYLVFELLFFVYRFLLGFSIYTFMIPKQIFKNRFRFWMIIRNMLLGAVNNLCFFFPYISHYIVIFDMLLTMLLIVCVYFSLKRKYVNELVGHLLFRALVMWIAIYEAVSVLVFVVRVLI